MKMCKNCRYKGCALCGTDHVIHAADCENYTPASNADRVRSMDDYDLAIFLENVSCKHADTESWLDWLKEPIGEGE